MPDKNNSRRGPAPHTFRNPHRQPAASRVLARLRCAPSPSAPKPGAGVPTPLHVIQPHRYKVTLSRPPKDPSSPTPSPARLPVNTAAVCLLAQPPRLFGFGLLGNKPPPPLPRRAADGNGRLRLPRRVRRQNPSPSPWAERAPGPHPEPRIREAFAAHPRLRQVPRQPPPRRRGRGQQQRRRRRQRHRAPRAPHDRAARRAQDGRLHEDAQERPALLLRGDAGPRAAGGRPER